MPKIVTRANKDVINWCECETAIAAYPGQLVCPWCGCGWLFSCHICRKAFTYGVVTETDRDLTQLAKEDMKHRGMTANTRLALDWVEWMVKQLKPIDVGTHVVYFDGRIWPADKTPVRFKGWHAKHSMKVLPHAGADAASLNAALGDVDYWREREIAG